MPESFGGGATGGLKWDSGEGGDTTGEQAIQSSVQRRIYPPQPLVGRRNCPNKNVTQPLWGPLHTGAIAAAEAARRRRGRRHEDRKTSSRRVVAENKDPRIKKGGMEERRRRMKEKEGSRRASLKWAGKKVETPSRSHCQIAGTLRIR